MCPWSAPGVKRKAAEGGSTETDMEALERQARKIQVRQSIINAVVLRSKPV